MQVVLTAWSPFMSYTDSGASAGVWPFPTGGQPDHSHLEEPGRAAGEDDDRVGPRSAIFVGAPLAPP